MRLILISIGMLLLNTAMGAAEGITRGDRDFALGNLHATRKLFLDSVAGLTDAQWNYKPSPDKWSIAECAEHIAVSEEMLGGMVKKSVDAPATPEKRIPAAETRTKDEHLIAAVVDRSKKVQAPEVLRPTHRFSSPAEAVEHFRVSRDANIDFVDKTEAELRARFSPHPLLGQLDLYQWLLLISAHSERHTLQILEVKADPGFPRN
jgi:hypothetical protein